MPPSSRQTGSFAVLYETCHFVLLRIIFIALFVAVMGLWRQKHAKLWEGFVTQRQMDTFHSGAFSLTLFKTVSYFHCLLSRPVPLSLCMFYFFDCNSDKSQFSPKRIFSFFLFQLLISFLSQHWLCCCRSALVCLGSSSSEKPPRNWRELHFQFFVIFF